MLQGTTWYVTYFFPFKFNLLALVIWGAITKFAKSLISMTEPKKKLTYGIGYVTANIYLLNVHSMMMKI